MCITLSIYCSLLVRCTADRHPPPPPPPPHPPTAPSSGLYFTLAGTVYLPGDTVLIHDIGDFASMVDITHPGRSLVCVTSNVNTECCRGSDGGRAGEWYFPDGYQVPRNAESEDFSRSGFTQQVRLNRRNNPIGPTGAYECRVPSLGDGTLVIASITIAVG